MGLGSWLARVLGFDRHRVEHVVLTKAALRQIMIFARENHPNEFSALLEGKIKKGTLTISHVVYQHYEADDRSAIIHLNYPMSTNVIGTVHSHPSKDIRPSAADKRYFNKYGFVNFIIGKPYDLHSIACYDGKGRPLQFYVR